jgi:Cys-tRNA synthase (O-phospho-L-seryl-tRNA:Cys-tRNA synthase)
VSGVNDCASLVVEALEAEDLPYMLVGAYSSGAYAVPRGTKDVDFVLSAHSGAAFDGVLRRLEPHFEFDPQISFETITGSRRHILTSRTNRGLQVELFLLGDDAFMQERFRRRRHEYLAQLDRRVSIPTAEDVIVQKLRWGRPKDIEDVRDVMAVQRLSTLDMAYIEHWCAKHGTTERLRAVIESIPPDLR